MEKNNTRTTNTDIVNSLEQLNHGRNDNANQLVFDNATGEFVVVRPNEQVSADGTTINSIARDGFAK
jgi:hypothetical protein